MSLFNISTLSALTEQIAGTVGDEFRKLIQPQSLVASAIFIALNLTLVLPELVNQGFTVAVTFANLPTTWQTVVGALTLVILTIVASC
jgi:hypothetical protein